MSELIDNEQTKLLANALDRASTACFTVGIATPIAGMVYNIGSFGASLSMIRISFGLGMLAFRVDAITLMARHILKGLMR